MKKTMNNCIRKRTYGTQRGPGERTEQRNWPYGSVCSPTAPCAAPSSILVRRPGIYANDASVGWDDRMWRSGRQLLDNGKHCLPVRSRG
jgi:hypothetical protein